LVIRNRGYDDSLETINDRLGTLANVLHQNKSFVLISLHLYQSLGMDKKRRVKETDHIFINWRIYSQTKQKQGRFPLFTALEHNLTWSDGLNKIIKGYGAAVEDVDIVTGLEAFMLAAVGTKSNMETVFLLLQDHPAAIIPYVRTN